MTELREQQFLVLGTETFELLLAINEGLELAALLAEFFVIGSFLFVFLHVLIMITILVCTSLRIQTTVNVRSIIAHQGQFLSSFFAT